MDLRHTAVKELYLHENSITNGSAFFSNDLLFCSIRELYLASNPMGELKNCQFRTGTIRVLSLVSCDIASLVNVVFDAECVYLNDNPLSIVKNVTFQNVKFVAMVNCGITWDIFKTWKAQIIWMPADHKLIKWSLFRNPLQWTDLRANHYFMPPWLSTITLSDGDYHGPIYEKWLQLR